MPCVGGCAERSRPTMRRLARARAREQRSDAAPTRFTNKGALALVSGVDRRGSASVRSQFWKPMYLGSRI